MTSKYVLGFVFDPLLVNVVLIRKTRGPKTAIGWNGVGGHIEEGEDRTEAMRREMLEEANVLVRSADWLHLQTIERPMGNVEVFGAATPAIGLARSRTDEEVCIFAAHDLHFLDGFASDARWFSAMARTRLRSLHHPDWRVS